MLYNMENWDYEKQSVTVEAIRLDGNYFGGQSDQLKTGTLGSRSKLEPRDEVWIQGTGEEHGKVREAGF